MFKLCDQQSFYEVQRRGDADKNGNIIIPIYYGYDDDGSPLINTDCMREEYDNDLNELINAAKNSDNYGF